MYWNQKREQYSPQPDLKESCPRTKRQLITETVIKPDLDQNQIYTKQTYHSASYKIPLVCFSH